MDLAWLAAIVTLGFGVLVSQYLRHDYRFGLGPDMPVYLWWSRVGAASGLSIVGERPGTPALIPTISGTLHLPVVAVAAALEVVLGSCIGGAVAALVRDSGRGEPLDGPRLRAPWIFAGVLAGLFSVHLAAGYLANLAFALPFIAAGVALAARTRRATVASALLLGGGGLAHPQFFLLGIGILGLAAITSLARGQRGWASDAGRVFCAALGSAALVAAGVASMHTGAPMLNVDTSKDGFLRRSGLTSALRHAYSDRFVHRWARYVLWVALPLSVPGGLALRGFVRRFLVAWTTVLVIGAPIGLLTGWYPADRMLTFGFPIAALAGVGIAWVASVLASRRVLAFGATGALLAAMAAGALIAWSRQVPFISPLEVARATTAARIAQTLPPGTPLVFVVDDTDVTATFLATRAANVIRAAMPPSRVPDVYVYVGTTANFLAGKPTTRDNLEYDTLSRTSLHDVPVDPPRPATVFVLTPFNRTPQGRSSSELVRWSRGVFASRPGPSPLAMATDPLRPSSAIGIAFASIAVLALLWVAGYGWSRASLEDPVSAVAAAPAFGVAILILAAIALERGGVPLTGSWSPTIVSTIGGGGGYVWLLAQRKTRRGASPPV